MIAENDIVRVRINRFYFSVAEFEAKEAEVGGVSRIFSDKAERLERQKIDSLVGQLGTLAGNKLFSGGIEGYIQSRYMQNKFPHIGDGGEDIIGTNIDFKVSLWRYDHMTALDYHLLVRPRERHERQIYVHGLIKPWEDESFPKEVIFTGWATDSDLPTEPVKSGPLEGAYAIKAEELKPLPPIEWKWFTRKDT
jgi:hypothetical protein